MVDGDRKHTESRLALGHGTSNEAEFEILIVALKRIAKYVERRCLDKKAVEIAMRTDSMILANRISGKNKKGLNALRNSLGQAFLGDIEEKISPKKEAERRMARLAQECLDILVHFGSYHIQWTSRDLNVSKFGH